MPKEGTATQGHTEEVTQRAVTSADEGLHGGEEQGAPRMDASADEDEEEMCGFCKFMKGGGCRSAFVAWSDCVDKERESGSDFTEECREKTLALRACMLQHRDYYAPLLAEEEEYAREAEQGQQTQAAQQATQ